MPRGNEVGLVIGFSRSRGHAIRAQHKVVYLTMHDGGRAVQGAAVIHQPDAVGTACLEAVAATLGVGHPVVSQASKLRHIKRSADVKQTIVIKHIEEFIRTAQRVGAAQRSGQHTAADAQRRTGNSAAQRSIGQNDITCSGVHSGIVRYIQSTTGLRDSDSSVIPCRKRLIVNGTCRGRIIPCQQVLAPGDSATRSGNAIGTEHQIVRTMGHSRTIGHSQHAAV